MKKWFCHKDWGWPLTLTVLCCRVPTGIAHISVSSSRAENTAVSGISLQLPWLELEGSSLELLADIWSSFEEQLSLPSLLLFLLCTECLKKENRSYENTRKENKLRNIISNTKCIKNERELWRFIVNLLWKCTQQSLFRLLSELHRKPRVITIYTMRSPAKAMKWAPKPRLNSRTLTTDYGKSVKRSFLGQIFKKVFAIFANVFIHLPLKSFS